MNRDHINHLQWHQAIGFARQASARIFRDGGAPADAMRAFGIDVDGAVAPDWQKAVEAIPDVICTQPQRQAA